MLRPTPGDPWGVEQPHWNTGAEENQQLNPGCIYVCNIRYFFLYVGIELFVHIYFDLYTLQILEEIKNIIIIIIITNLFHTK